MSVRLESGKITSINWINSGWGSHLDPKFNATKKYYVDYGEFTKPTNSYLDTARQTINHITNTYPPPYYLMLSGGIDSQTMLWAWINSGVPFIPITFKYVDNTGKNSTPFNDYDYAGMLEFCKTHAVLNYEFRELDIISFLENELVNFVKKYRCTSPQICTHMKMVTLLGEEGTKIFSGNFADCRYTYTIFGLDRFATYSTHNVIPFFLLYTKDIASHGEFVIHKKDHYSKKIQHLRSLGIPVIPQPGKQTGFEKIKDYYDLHASKVTVLDRLRFSSMPSKRVFDILFRYKFMSVTPYIDEVVYQGGYLSSNV